MEAGKRLGPYEIEDLIGQGGMGQVYRARDTRLERTVAVKILSRDISASAERQQRFEREAKTISSLQHPNICVLYDIGNDNGVDYLVMEYLDGRSLADRLRHGPLNTEEALRLGIEIAGALEKAHRQGIVHRDLKPGNVMLTKSGAKLLDFGLAKPFAMATASGADMATLTGSQRDPVTARGTIVGTFQYMAPEQLQGKEADARSDIFALGSVLYEAATGKPAFTGQTQISVMSAILEREPEPVTSISAASPPALDYVIRTCLAKDPDLRFQTAHDVGLQLKWIAGQTTKTPAIAGVRKRQTWTLMIAVLAVLTAFAIAIFAYVTLRSRPTELVRRYSIPYPPGNKIPGDVGSVAIARDGAKIAYVASENGSSSLFVRRLDQFEPAAIPNSDNATYPFFSPDGQSIAFFAHGRLYRAAADGSTNPIAITDLPGAFYGGSWLPNGTILLASSPPLLTVSAEGGTPAALPTKGARVDTGDPIELPGGEWILFTDDKQGTYDIYKYQMSTGQTSLLLANAMAPIYSVGFLVYYSSGSIWAAPFDRKTARVLGPGTVIARDVTAGAWFGHFAASENGTLIYIPGADQSAAHDLVWVDRKGNGKKIEVPDRDYVDPSIAPDGKHFAVCIRTAGAQSLAIYDVGRGSMLRMTGVTGRTTAPTWDPTGKYIYFDSGSAIGKMGIYRMLSDGSAKPMLLHEVMSFGHVTSVVEGKAAVMLNDPVTKADLWIMSPDGSQLTPFRKTTAIERQGSFSPDGKYLAYASDESGVSEVYVEPANGSGARWQISVGGGEQPKWSRKGNEIFYRNSTKMMSVAVTEDPFAAGKPIVLFDRGFDRGGAVAGYDVTPDGQHFLMTDAAKTGPTEIRVVVGWPNELKGKSSTGTGQ